MKKRAPEDLEKVTINLFKGDMRVLQDLFPENGGGYAIRALVRKFILQTKEKANG